MGERITRQGWEYLCRLRAPMYPDLVYKFYHKLKFKVGSMISMVKDVDIE